MKWIALTIAVIVAATGVYVSERWIEHQRYSVVRSSYRSLAYRLDRETGRVYVLVGYKAHPVVLEANPQKKIVSSLSDLDLEWGD